MPLLQHLKFSSNFDAKASDHINLQQSPLLHTVEGISADIFPLVHGQSRYLPGFPAPRNWNFKKCLATQPGRNIPTRDLRRSSQVVSDFRYQLSSLELLLHCEPSWFTLEIPGLTELRAIIQSHQVPDVLSIMQHSPLLTILKIVLYTEGDIPVEICASDLPTSTRLEELHLEANIKSDADNYSSHSLRSQRLSTWLVRLLASLLHTRPPLRDLTFRAVDALLERESSRTLLRELDKNVTLTHWSMPTQLSLDDVTDPVAFLPTLQTLTLLQPRLLSMLHAPELWSLEFIFRPEARAEVNFPSALEWNLPQLSTIKYSISRRVDRLCSVGGMGSIGKFIKVIEFVKNTPDQAETWPSYRVDEFCRLLLDDTVCPLIHTIGSDICPGWDILFKLLSRRNVFRYFRNGSGIDIRPRVYEHPQPIDCIRLSILPHSTILGPLVDLLRGKLPTKVHRYLTSLEGYANIDW
jgi:hypothetical protein